jgi:hypothetical protein
MKRKHKHKYEWRRVRCGFIAEGIACKVRHYLETCKCGRAKP